LFLGGEGDVAQIILGEVVLNFQDYFCFVSGQYRVGYDFFGFSCGVRGKKDSKNSYGLYYFCS
jgi:hypothetical protein